MDVKKYAGPVRIWSWFNDIWYARKTLKEIRNFQITLIIILRTVVRIQLKFNVCVCQRNAQVKFEFGHCLIIFVGLIPHEL
jgi:hypothetical protein